MLAENLYQGADLLTENLPSASFNLCRPRPAERQLLVQSLRAQLRPNRLD